MGLVSSPFVLYLFLTLLGVHLVWKYILLAIVFSLLTILYAIYVFIWILKQEPGSSDMKEIADCINEGTFLN